MIEEIEQLIVRCNTKADLLEESIKTVNTSDLYADQREEWQWYLKGQRQTLRDIALDLRVILLKNKVASNENS